MIDDTPNYDRILENIAACRDIDKLTTFVSNAQKRGVIVVKDAAVKQLKSLIPVHKKGSFEKAFWEMFLQYQALLFEHGKPTLKLNKSWKTALCDGEIKALCDWVDDGRQVWALDNILSRSPQALTAEKLVLNFPDIFDAEIQQKAAQNLQLAKARLLEMK